MNIRDHGNPHTRKDLRKGVRAVVEDRWGDDPALPVLVEMIALGKYLT
jgi:hypothetical protein